MRQTVGHYFEEERTKRAFKSVKLPQSVRLFSDYRLVSNVINETFKKRTGRWDDIQYI